ncbi:vWA domain-containing protein [Microbispora sp. NPDC088329]|uniref:vWA domain-containing protein n=1 Tax=Microbispora sp. NPDC088329 TaxID=3154869 RepID=UPI00343005D5
MSPSPSNSGEAPDNKDDAKSPNRQPEVTLARQTVISTALTILTTGVLNKFITLTDQGLFGWFVTMLTIGLIGGVLLQLPGPARVRAWLMRRSRPSVSAISPRPEDVPPRRRQVGRIRECLRRVWPPLAISYLSVTLGLVVALIVVGIVKVTPTLYRLALPPSCAEPRELSVMTAPENVDALRGKVSAFIAETRVDDCAAYRISVFPAPSIKGMIHGFDDGWRRDDAAQSNEPFRRLFGPRPDAWIATSSEEVDFVRCEVGRPQGAGEKECGDEDPVRLEKRSSVANDHLAIAMLGERVPDLKGLPPQKGLAGVVRAIRRELDMRLLYPQPGLSSAGLIAAAQLVNHEDSKETAESVAFDNSVNALLCRFEGLGGKKKDIALFVPSHSVQDYPGRKNTGEGCTGTNGNNAGALTEAEVTGLPALDYPFVHIHWPEEDQGRSDAIDGFGAWLAGHKLFDRPAPGRASTVSSAALRAAEKQIKDRLPPVDIQLLLDISGSMSGSPSALLLTRQAIPGIWQTLTESDRLSLSTFYLHEGVNVAQPSPKQGVDDLHEFITEVAKVTSNGADAPISATIRKLGPLVKKPARSLVIITDGGPFRLEKDPRGAEHAIAQALEQSPSIRDLYLLVLKRDKCGGMVPAPEHPGRRSKHLVCAEVESGSSSSLQAGDVENALIEMISTVREWS